MEKSVAYSIIKALIEENSLVIQRQGFTEWLDRLESKGEIRAREIEDLLQLADQLEIYALPGGRFVSSEKLPSLGEVQDHALLLHTAPGAFGWDSGNSTGRLENFVYRYLGYWAINSMILGIGLSVTI